MNFDKALKAFRRLGYKYGEAANGLIISANVNQQSIVFRQAQAIMHCGTAEMITDHGARKIQMVGGGWLRFYTVDDVFNGLTKGLNVPYVGVTQLAQLNGGVTLDHQVIPQLRSPQVPEQDCLYLTLENI